MLSTSPQRASETPLLLDPGADVGAYIHIYRYWKHDDPREKQMETNNRELAEE